MRLNLNPDWSMRVRIYLSDGDIDPLAAFLRSLNEDYN